MRFEGDGDGLPIFLPRPLDDLREHVDVRVMHAVKVPNAYERGTEVRGYFFEFVEDSHVLWCGRPARIFYFKRHSPI